MRHRQRKTPGETEYTLTLREGITFTDGETFDAVAVVTNYDNLRDADYNPSALIAEPVHIDSVTARDDYDWAPTGASHSGPAYLEQIDYRILPESTTRVGAPTSGQVDVVTEIATPDVTALKDASEIG